MVRDGIATAAVMAAELIGAFVVGERNATRTAMRNVATLRALQPRSEATPIVEEDYAFMFSNALDDRFKQYASVARSALRACGAYRCTDTRSLPLADANEGAFIVEYPGA